MERMRKMAKKRRPARKTKTRRRRRVLKAWSAAEVRKLKRLFPNNPTSRIAAELGRNTDAVKKKASRMGLRKSPKYLRKLGRA